MASPKGFDAGAAQSVARGARGADGDGMAVKLPEAQPKLQIEGLEALGNGEGAVNRHGASSCVAILLHGGRA